MIPPALPSDEAQRLESLHRLELLHTAAEERFDRITRAVSRFFQVPIALVSLVDAERQWFKSSVGVDVQETPRSVSFCGHAILQDDVFVVPDAKADPRFADNPLVTGEMGIRFYAGKPIRGPGGYKVGTLCVLDRQPRNFTEDECRALKDFAAWAELELNQHELGRALEDARGCRALLKAAQEALQVSRDGNAKADVV